MKTLSTFILCLILCHSVFANLLPKAAITADRVALEQGCAWLDLYLYDEFGDGWNGAVLTVYDWNYNIAFTTTLPEANGSYYYTYTCIEPGCYRIAVTAGLYPAEITWYAYENNSTLLASGGAPSGEVPFTLGTPVYGCTDSFSCSYNPAATCDDGSCCYDDCLFLYLYDSFGDGWNGAYFTMEDNAGNILFNETISANEGTYHAATVCAEGGCYRIQVSDGSFPSEITWQLYHYSYYGADFLQIASGVAPHDQLFGLGQACDFEGCAKEEACNYDPWVAYQSGDCCFDNCGFVSMSDSYDDGWNGGGYTLRNWKSEVVESGTLAIGSYGYDLFCLPDGCYEFEVSSGLYPSNMAWTYYDGTNIETGDGPETHSFQIGNIISGCVNSAAVNYNPEANCATECFITCDADLDGNGVVNVADLLIFSSQFGNVCYGFN